MSSTGVCKLNIEKANDHVNWDALFYLFGWMGFGVRQRGCIKAFITTICFFVPVNGSPKIFLEALVR